MPANSADSSLLPGASLGTFVDLRRLPWVRPIAADYAYDFPKLAPFFAGDPASPAAWTDAIARAASSQRPTREIATIVAEQQRRRGAPEQATAAAKQLFDARSVAVLTGQQAGLFGGPLFTLLKALTALQLAERISRDHGVPAVAVFWIEAEDHDWDEVRSSTVLDETLSLRTVALPPAGDGRALPVGSIRVDDSIGEVLAALEAALPATEFRSELLTALRDSYTQGQGMADAFGRWLERTLGRRGLVVYDASDPAAKPLVSAVFARGQGIQGLTGQWGTQPRPDSTLYETMCNVHGRCTLQHSWLTRFLRGVTSSSTWLGPELVARVDRAALGRVATLDDTSYGVRFQLRPDATLDELELVLAELLPSEADYRAGIDRFHGRAKPLG